MELFHIFGVTCVDQIYLRMKHLGAILFALLLVVAVAEDDGARRIRELRELAAKSPGKIIPIDGREFKYPITHSESTSSRAQGLTMESSISQPKAAPSASTPLFT